MPPLLRPPGGSPVHVAPPGPVSDLTNTLHTKAADAARQELVRQAVERARAAVTRSVSVHRYSSVAGAGPDFTHSTHASAGAAAAAAAHAHVAGGHAHAKIKQPPRLAPSLLSTVIGKLHAMCETRTTQGLQTLSNFLHEDLEAQRNEAGTTPSASARQALTLAGLKAELKRLQALYRALVQKWDTQILIAESEQQEAKHAVAQHHSAATPMDAAAAAAAGDVPAAPAFLGGITCTCTARKTTECPIYTYKAFLYQGGKAALLSLHSVFDESQQSSPADIVRQARGEIYGWSLRTLWKCASLYSADILLRCTREIKARALAASCDAYEAITSPENKRVILYLLTAGIPSGDAPEQRKKDALLESWTVRKRYSEVLVFHRALSAMIKAQQLSDVKLWAMPYKTIAFHGTSHEIVFSRRVRFNEMFRDLTHPSSYDVLFQHPPALDLVESFLNVPMSNFGGGLTKSMFQVCALQLAEHCRSGMAIRAPVMHALFEILVDRMTDVDTVVNQSAASTAESSFFAFGAPLEMSAVPLIFACLRAVPAQLCDAAVEHLASVLVSFMRNMAVATAETFAIIRLPPDDCNEGDQSTSKSTAKKKGGFFSKRRGGKPEAGAGPSGGSDGKNEAADFLELYVPGALDSAIQANLLIRDVARQSKIQRALASARMGRLEGMDGSNFAEQQSVKVKAAAAQAAAEATTMKTAQTYSQRKFYGLQFPTDFGLWVLPVLLRAAKDRATPGSDSRRVFLVTLSLLVAQFRECLLCNDAPEVMERFLERTVIVFGEVDRWSQSSVALIRTFLTHLLSAVADPPFIALLGPIDNPAWNNVVEFFSVIERLLPLMDLACSSKVQPKQESANLHISVRESVLVAQTAAPMTAHSDTASQHIPPGLVLPTLNHVRLVEHILNLMNLPALEQSISTKGASSSVAEGIIARLQEFSTYIKTAVGMMRGAVSIVGVKLPASAQTIEEAAPAASSTSPVTGAAGGDGGCGSDMDDDTAALLDMLASGEGESDMVFYDDTSVVGMRAEELQNSDDVYGNAHLDQLPPGAVEDKEDVYDEDDDDEDD